MAKPKEAVPPLSSITVGGHTLNLEYLLNAPYEDIQEAAEQIPAALGWLGHQRANAVERLILSEFSWKEAESKSYFDLKNGSFTSEGFGEKQSEEALKRAIISMPEVKAAAAEYAKRKKHVSWISSTIDALNAKLELVRSSEATRRLEHEMDFSQHD